MSGLYILLKVAHIVGACVLLGTGIGIAFFMWMANRTGEAGIIAATARVVVIADAVFTATAVVMQPVTGVALAEMAGIPLRSPWIVWSLVLYALAGAATGLPSTVPRVVLPRLAGLRRSRRNHRPDDCQTDAVVRN